MAWHWCCNGEDSRRGSFHPDYEGRCGAHSRKGFSSEEGAREAGRRHAHKCDFGARVRVFESRKSPARLWGLR